MMRFLADVRQRHGKGADRGEFHFAAGLDICE
jgi:hypothetical protein